MDEGRGWTLPFLIAPRKAPEGGGQPERSEEGGRVEAASNVRKRAVVRGVLGKVTFWMPSRQQRAPGRPAFSWRDGMPIVSGFSAFASIPEERITDKVSRRIVS